MSYSLLLLQNTAATAAKAVPLEKQPASLSLIFMAGLALMILLLILSLLFGSKPPRQRALDSRKELSDEDRCDRQD